MVAEVPHASECIIMFLIIDFSIEYGLHSQPAVPDLDNPDTLLCRANLSKF